MMVVRKLKVKNQEGKFVDCKIGSNNTDLLNFFYPVGSYYETSDINFNPNTVWGGTWVEDTGGEVLMSRTKSGIFHTVGDNVGANTISLTASNIPSHTHTVPAHAHSLNSHTHSIGAHSHGLNGHTHTIGAHSHGLNGHNHTIPALSGYTSVAGLHAHNGKSLANASNTGSNNYVRDWDHSGDVSQITDSQGNHSHTVATYADVTGGASGSTANSSAFTSGGASGSTANSSAFTSGQASGNTANSSVLTSGATGDGTAINVVQKSKICIRWHRTA